MSDGSSTSSSDEFDDDEASENAIEVGSEGDEFYVRPGDVEDAAILQERMDEQQRHSDDENEDMKALGGEEVRAIANLCLEVDFVKNYDSTFHTSENLNFKAGEVYASIKRKLIRKMNMDINLYRDCERKDSISNREKIIEGKIYAEVRCFFPLQNDEDTENFCKNCPRHKMALCAIDSLLAEDIKMSLKNDAVRVSDRNIQIHKNPHSVTHGEHKYKSSCVSGKSLTFHEKQEELSRCFSIFFSRSLIEKIFSPSNEIGRIFRDFLINVGKNFHLIQEKSLNFDQFLDTTIFPDMFNTMQCGYIFSFVDEIKCDHLIHCVFRVLLASLREIEGLPSFDPNDSTKKYTVSNMPWGNFKYTAGEICRLSKIVSVWINFYKCSVRFSKYKGNEFVRHARVYLNTHKEKYKEVFQRIFQNSKKFELGSNYGSRKALLYLFRYFLTVCVANLTRNNGNSQIIRIRGQAYIEVGKLHINGGTDEGVDDGGMYIRVQASGVIELSSNFETFSQYDMAKDMWLKWVKWKSGSIGLITRSLGDAIFVVLLLEENGHTLGLWRYTSSTEVRVCSHDMKCKGNACINCGKILIGGECVCSSLSTSADQAFFSLKYDNDEIYNVLFSVGQIIHVNSSVFQHKIASPYVSAYIESIRGPLLRICANFHSPKSIEMHFLNPNISVPLKGNGPIHTLRIIELKKKIMYRKICTSVNVVCAWCKRGPKGYKCNCAFCGGVSISVQTHFHDNVPSRDTFSVYVEEFISLVTKIRASFFSMLCIVGSNVIKDCSSAILILNEINVSIVHSAYLSVLSFRGKKVTLNRSDTTMQEFFVDLENARSMRDRIQYAIMTERSNFWERLSTWAKDDSMLSKSVEVCTWEEQYRRFRGMNANYTIDMHVRNGFTYPVSESLSRRDREIETICSSFPKKATNDDLCAPSVEDVKLQLRDMRESNRIISDRLELLTIQKYHDRFFPYCDVSGIFSIGDRLCGDVKVGCLLEYTLCGRKYYISASTSFTRNFSLCNCMTDAECGAVGIVVNEGNMLCCGPFMGLSSSRYSEICKMIREMCGTQDGLYRTFSEEHASLYFLHKIYDVLLPKSVEDHLDLRIFILYRMCMFFWYAFCNCTFERRKKQIKRGFDDTTKDDQNVQTINWYQRYKEAPFLNFILAFYGHKKNRHIAEPFSKVQRTKIIDEDDIPSDMSITARLQSADDFILKMLPYNSVSPMSSDIDVENVSNKWRGFDQKKSTSAPQNFEMCGTDYVEFDISSDEFRHIYHNIWLHMRQLTQPFSACRSQHDFFILLRGYQSNRNGHDVMWKTCGSRDCEQCEILQMLSDINRGQSVRCARKIKRIIRNADLQLRTFGKIQSWNICEHYRSFFDCHICTKAFQPCMKSGQCLKDSNGNFLCPKKHYASIYMSNGYNIAFCDPGHDCKSLRFCARDNPCLFDASLCQFLDFHRPGHDVDYA